MVFIGTFIPIIATRLYMFHLGIHPRGDGIQVAAGVSPLAGDTHRGIGM